MISYKNQGITKWKFQIRLPRTVVLLNDNYFLAKMGLFTELGTLNETLFFFWESHLLCPGLYRVTKFHFWQLLAQCCNQRYIYFFRCFALKYKPFYLFTAKLLRQKAMDTPINKVCWEVKYRLTFFLFYHKFSTSSVEMMGFFARYSKIWK